MKSNVIFVITLFFTIFGTTVTAQGQNSFNPEYTTGMISGFSDTYYDNDQAVIKVIDNDMKGNNGEIASLKVNVWSYTDAGGIQVTLYETKSGSGDFKAKIYFSSHSSPSENTLQVSNGDKVTAEYVDDLSQIGVPENIDMFTYIKAAVALPSPPLNLVATVSNSDTKLAWDPSENNGGSNIIGYKIERNDGSGYQTIVANTESTLTTYTDTSLSPNTTHTYRVSAINSAGTGFSSNTAMIPVLSSEPGAPSSLTATAISSSQISLNWIAPLDNGGSPVKGYKIERKSNTDSYFTLVPNTATTSTSYLDRGLLIDSTYTYRISAINLIGTSNPSNEASISIQPNPYDFKINANSSLLEIKQGASTEYPITVATLDGMPKPILLTCSFQTPSIQCTVTPSVLNTDGSAIITVASDKNIKPGDYVGYVTARGGELNHDADIHVVISDASSDWSISPLVLPVSGGTAGVGGGAYVINKIWKLKKIEGPKQPNGSGKPVAPYPRIEIEVGMNE